LNHGRAPRVVFTEACYGSHIFGKSVEQSIALKFLASGSQAIVGATCVAYGGVTTPLTAADLLGHSFWSSISRGTPAGEALRQAKIHLAREMHRRQGYLDGEDQKTLIAFVLYGDPLADPYSAKRSPKSLLRPMRWQSTVKVICDRTDDIETPQPASREVMAHAKRVVAQYLPGMTDAQYSISQEHAQCDGVKHKCPSAQFGGASKPSRPPVRRVVTLSKQVQRGSTVHNHYARLTLDSTGKLVKLVVSR